MIRLRAFVIFVLAILIALTAFSRQAQATPMSIETSTLTPTPTATNTPTPTNTPFQGGGGGGGSTPTATPVQPTATPVFPTATPEPPTATPIPTATPVLVIADAQGVVGETVNIDVVFSNPLGTGFFVLNMGVTIEDPTLVEFVDVQLPDWIDPFIAEFLMDIIAPDGFPTASINLIVIDLEDSMGGVIANEVLATMSLHLITAGETRLLLNMVQLEDDLVESLIPITEAPTSVTIIGSSSNLPPVAVGDFYSVHQDSSIDTVLDGLPGALDNDTDPEDDDLTANLVDDVANGTLALNEDGSFVYTPNPGFNGKDSFIYVASDGQLVSNEATVTITVVPLCTLDIEPSYADGTLTIDLDVGTLEPALWNIWLVALGQVFPIWSTPIPITDPPQSFPFPIPGFPSIGKVGFLTAMFTADGMICSDWATVDTGAPSSSTLAPEELRKLFENVGVKQIISDN